MMFKKTMISTLLIASSFSVMAEDSHLHTGDLQPWRIGAEIFLNSEVFEVDFGDLGGGAYATDNPGIDANIEKGAFQPGNWLQLKALATLQFWDGDEWSSAMPNGEYINVVDALDNTVRIDANSTSESTMVIGEIDNNGGLHTHIDFSLLDASNSLNGSQGAYRIELKLFETAPNSELSVSYAAKPVMIIFNQGLAEEDFEHAVEATSDHDDHDDYADVEYDAATGMLSIPNVKALGKHYQVKLKNEGDFKFQLTEAFELPESEDHDDHEDHDDDDDDHDDHEEHQH